MAGPSELRRIQALEICDVRHRACDARGGLPPEGRSSGAKRGEGCQMLRFTPPSARVLAPAVALITLVACGEHTQTPTGAVGPPQHRLGPHPGPGGEQSATRA